MKRKLVTLLLTLILLFSLTVSVSADILWSPRDNDYYRAYTDAMDRVDRSYVVPNGMTANLYEGPNGNRIQTLTAGDRIYIGSCLELQGETWAVGRVYDLAYTEGWVRLNRLQVEYDHKAFLEDFADDIVSVDEYLDVSNFDRNIYTWTWPGSGTISEIIEPSSFDPDKFYHDGRMTYSYMYTDPNGGHWGYVGYFLAPCGWVYLDDPTTARPDLNLSPTVKNTVTDTAPEEDTPVWAYGVPLLLPMSALCILTAVLIHVLKNRKYS